MKVEEKKKRNNMKLLAYDNIRYVSVRGYG